ncbi:hypothetical protein PsorP6_008697 [Peronosclerospora sorghi]|uniref:Uncharacterized protein n=1 Tax=Peronosclerospora sorghi TaxID=230839 RepID=A0ACC0VZW2_9STRA|nr:hypothetical protein PsorP6_008697 [Peronosclerospora sorghi]
MLIHSCNCDDTPCRDPEFRCLYGHMKRFLRGACWASPNERWRSHLIAKVVIEPFTYHALHCQTLQCIVPMCRQFRGQVLPSSMNIGRQRRKRFIYNWPKCDSQLRIRANREKPVDLMAKNLLLVSAKHGEDDDDCFKKEIGSIRVEHRRSHAIVDGLSMDELTELQEDVCTCKELE